MTPPRAAEVRRVLKLVLVLNLLVVAVKLGAWWLSHALSVVAEVTHSSLDAANNVFALGMAGVAARGPDEDHPYGHQKFETLGALVLVGVLSITVFELVQRAVARLVSGVTPGLDATPLAIALLALSLVAGSFITLYEARKARELDSHLLLADAAHTRSDVLATVAVLGGLLAVRAGYPQVDPWITLGVAAVIARTGWSIVRATVPVLVDERAVHPEHIRRVAEDVDGVHAAYAIRSRGGSGHVFAELTIGVDPQLDVALSHELADRVEHEVSESVGADRVVVHVEPFEPGHNVD